MDDTSVPIYTDGRGRVGNFRSFPKVEGLHVLTMQPGAARGNHVHDQDEVMCVLGGSGICEITAADEVSGEREEFVMEGDISTYRIGAGIKHTVRNIGNDVFYLVVFMSEAGV